MSYRADDRQTTNTQTDTTENNTTLAARVVKCDSKCLLMKLLRYSSTRTVPTCKTLCCFVGFSGDGREQSESDASYQFIASWYVIHRCFADVTARLSIIEHYFSFSLALT